MTTKRLAALLEKARASGDAAQFKRFCYAVERTIGASEDAGDTCWPAESFNLLLEAIGTPSSQTLPNPEEGWMVILFCWWALTCDQQHRVLEAIAAVYALTLCDKACFIMAHEILGQKSESGEGVTILAGFAELAGSSHVMHRCYIPSALWHVITSGRAGTTTCSTALAVLLSLRADPSERVRGQAEHCLGALERDGSYSP